MRGHLLAADLLDLVVAGALGGAAGTLTYVVAAPPRGTSDGWAELGAVIGGLVVGTVVTGLVLVGVLVATGRSRSVGDRIVRRPRREPSLRRAVARLGRWVAVGASLAGVSALAGVAEPGIEGVVAPGVGVAIAVGVFALAYVDLSTRATRRRVAALVGGTGVVVAALAGAVPDRAPYDWEVRTAVEEQLPTSLAALGAQPLCTDVGVLRGPSASHGTRPCADPEETWSTAMAPRAFVAVLADRTRQAHPGVDVVVAERTSADGGAVHVLEVRGLPVAHVAATPCGTRVVIGTRIVVTGDLTPDLASDGRCA